MGAARIGRVRMKTGGAELRLICQERTDAGGAENWRGDIAGHDQVGQELCGFVVLGLFADGATSIGWRYDHERAQVPRAMLPAWVAEVIRRDLITHPEAVETYNRIEGHE